MPTNVHHIPAGFHAITPYFIVNDAPRFVAFMKEVFGAEEISRFAEPGGRIHHASLRIEDSMIELSDGSPAYPAMPLSLHLYVPDVDATYARALKAGGVSKSGPIDHFYGERGADIEDPCGNRWFIATHVEDISDEELARRAAAQGA
ncbi:MAG TPA: VOC family protein [Opitutaceae bacterium]|nr:VOC family protein [Opitutaceae bacterium]